MASQANNPSHWAIPVAKIVMTGGTMNVSSSDTSVPASSTGEYFNCAYAVRDTILRISPRLSYGRTLTARCVSPSQIDPCFLSRRPMAQSSMISSRMASIPPPASSEAR